MSHRRRDRYQNAGHQNTAHQNQGSFAAGYPRNDYNNMQQNTSQIDRFENEGGMTAPRGNRQDGWSNSNESGFNQGNSGQGSYNRPNFNQGNFNQGNYNQNNYDQSNYNQGGYNQGGSNQGNYNQGSYNQGIEGDYSQGRESFNESDSNYAYFKGPSQRRSGYLESQRSDYQGNQSRPNEGEYDMDRTRFDANRQSGGGYSSQRYGETGGSSGGGYSPDRQDRYSSGQQRQANGWSDASSEQFSRDNQFGYTPQSSSSGRGGRTGMDRRGSGPKNYKRSDERISEDVCEHLMSQGLDCSGVEVNVKDGIVTLTGEVCHRSDKHHIEQIAADISGVTDVENQLRMKKQSASDSSVELKDKDSSRQQESPSTKSQIAGTASGKESWQGGSKK